MKSSINNIFMKNCNSCVPYFLTIAGAFACKMVPFVQSTAIVTEILTMTCIAVERHQGIVHPLKMKWQYTNKRAFTMLGKILGISTNFAYREIIFGADGVTEQKALIWSVIHR